LFGWSARKDEDAAVAAPAATRIAETLSASRALPKMLAALASHPTPVLLDLGPVVGANVSFFGERLCCKMLIEDLRQDVDAALRRGDPEGLGATLAARIEGAAVEPVHGVLCWDIVDCLDRPAARALAASLCRVLQPRGVLHGLFGTTSVDVDYRSKFILQSDTSMKWRREPAPALRRQALQTGEITRLFEGLSTVESVLLQNHTREVLLRKP
jgi:hypothetical protein